MKFDDQYKLSNNRETVWAYITDPFVLKDCIPSCKNITLTDDNSYLADVIIKLGFIKLPFQVRLQLSDIENHQSYLLSAEVIDGPAKSTYGSSKISLQSADNQHTILQYEAEAFPNKKCSHLVRALSKFLQKNG